MSSDGRALTIGWLVIGTRITVNLEPKYWPECLPEIIGADDYIYACTTSWTNRGLQCVGINADTRYLGVTLVTTVLTVCDIE